MNSIVFFVHGYVIIERDGGVDMMWCVVFELFLSDIL